MASMRAVLATFVSELQGATASYQELRTAVWSGKDTVFGQNATINPFFAGEGTGLEGANLPEEEDSPIRQAAQNFAAQINPLQEKVLEQIANALEVVGQFTAGVDHSGQAYASADRKAKFPAPPPNPVTTV
jgi:phosphoglycerate dehydrogenase-like enzyme